MKDNVILFDLDDTLVVEYASAQETFSVVCEYAADYGVTPRQLMNERYSGKSSRTLVQYAYV